jgi:DNA-directed RNA polymerase subunit RPC12/RpoP
MEALDGNAIAGLLVDVFGTEMTMATGVCATCGAAGLLAEDAVYNRAPGTVVRCPSCESMLMVLVDVRGIYCVDLQGLASLQPGGAQTHSTVIEAALELDNRHER